MTWETALDRLVIRQMHLAEKKEIRHGEVKRIVDDLLGLGADRAEFAFHAGYSQALLGLTFPEYIGSIKDDPGKMRWHLYGQMKAHDRKGEKEWVAELVAQRDTLFDLLREPGIAWGLLPILMRTFFWEGNLDSAISALEYLALSSDEQGTAEKTVELVRAALTDILTLVEKRDEPEAELSNREVLRRCHAVEGFDGLPDDVRIRFDIAEGRTFLDSCEWGEADKFFARAVELAGENNRLASAALTYMAWGRLQVKSGLEITTDLDRPEREEVLTLLDKGCSEPDKAFPEAFFTRGIMVYEANDYAGARKDFEQALVLSRQSPKPNADLNAKIRFYLAAAILAGGQLEDARKAAYLIDQALDKVQPDLNTFYTVHESLKAVDHQVALKFLDAVDVSRGTSGDNLLMIALEYIGLGEAERAIDAARRVLKITTDLDQRIEGQKTILTAANMLGKPDEARGTYYEMRDLLLRRGRFADLEAILLDDAFVGQALDHIEAKCELVDLYEEMEGHEADRAQLQLAVARSLKARKDTENLSNSLAILRELNINYPNLAKDELNTVTKILELSADDGGGGQSVDPDRQTIQELAKQLGHQPSFLVVGGNERQRKHHPKFDQLAADWGFKGEWLMANYTSPQRLVTQIEERIKKQSIDGLMLLHWNRHETTEPALAVARQSHCPARTVFYAGFTSLQTALAQMINLLTSKADAKPTKEAKEKKTAAKKAVGKGRKKVKS